MRDTFNLKTFLVENKLTEASGLLQEISAPLIDATVVPVSKFKELITLFDKKTRYTVGDERRILEDGQVLLVVQNHPFPDSRLVQTERGLYFFDKGHGTTYFTSQLDMAEDLVSQITDLLTTRSSEAEEEPVPFESDEDFYDRKWQQNAGLDDMEEAFGEEPEEDVTPEMLVQIITRYYDIDTLAEKIADIVFNEDPEGNLMNFVEELVSSPSGAALE